MSCSINQSKEITFINCLMVSAFWKKSTCVLEGNNTLLKVGCVILCVMFRSLATTVYMFQMCFLTDKKEMLNIFNIISSLLIHFNLKTEQKMKNYPVDFMSFKRDMMV